MGVVSRDFLYVLERRGGRVEFYDLRTDPGALQELGAQHPEAARHAAYIEVASETSPDSDSLESDTADHATPESDPADQAVIDAETRRQLESLGYLPEDE